MSRYWGIDSYQLAAGQTISQQQLEQIDFQIVRIGTRGFGNMGNNSWYLKSLSVDPYCQSNIRATQDAGKPCGVYIFSYAWDARSAAVEANNVCDTLDLWGITTRLPVFIDWESTGTPPGTGSYEKFRDSLGRTVTAQEVQTIFRTFCETCTTRGRRSGWYTNGWFTPSLTPLSWISQMRSDGYFFWLASWMNAQDPPQDCDIWQYAGDQSWNGITTDYNWIINNAVIDGEPPTPPSDIPLWLKLHIARGNKNGKCTILL